MNDNRNTPTGASSDDTTSALFVSARKKQLAQQEAERKAKEKEEQRLAAEAEVQRLEREVDARRRQAEEEARRIEYENAEKRRLAEEEARRIAEVARARQVQAEKDPDSVLGANAQPKYNAPSMPNARTQHTSRVSSGSAKKPNPIIFVIAGVAAVVVIAVILIFTLRGGDGNDNGNINNPSIEATTPSPPDDSPRPSPTEPVPSIEYEIFGSYYLLDEFDKVIFDIEFFFDSDMTVRIGEESGWYDFEIDEDSLKIYIDGFTTEFLIINNDTLYSYEDGAHLIRNWADYEDASESYEPWAINPNAELDSVAYLKMINIGVSYPSDIFYVSENTDEFLQLRTHDPNGGFLTVQALASFDASGGIFADIVGPQVNGYGESVIRTTFSQLGDYNIVEEYPYSSQSPPGTLIQYSAVISCDVDGAPMSGIVRIGLWHSFINGQSTNVHHYYAIVLIVHDDVFSDYRQLYGNMRDNLFDS